MIDYYQPFLLPFLGIRKYKIPETIQRYYYYSFEDGLWDLLQKRHIPKGSTLLVPDFYCMDVISNIKSHGWNVEYYCLDNSFQISSTSFGGYCIKYNPSVVIIFHAVGITSTLSVDRSWTNTLQKDAIIIEDNVHRLIDPEKISIPHNNWYILDSVRKVSPLAGSFLYGTIPGMTFPQTTSRFNIFYVCSSFLLFILFRLTLLFGHIISSFSLIYFAHKKILLHHDTIIGDSVIPFRGLPIISYIHSFFNFEKVSKRKTTQVKLYETLLWQQTIKIFYRIQIPMKDYPMLHAYPIGVYGKISNSLYAVFKSRGMMIWGKFPDAPWSQNRTVLFLPLGFHINDTDIHNICNTILDI
jgi:hypothetical protein